MCGICGFYGFKDEVLLNKMCQTIQHRGPDQSGMYISDKASLGHRRLSIIDLSENGKQPMTNEDRSLYLIFNGEIYNFQSLRDGLLKKGHNFKSSSDSEVILHSYEEKGLGCVEDFRGMFSFAMWDSKRDRLILCRDRLGKKPLYYWWNGKRLVFASEIKSLMECSYIDKEVNMDGYSNYLAFQYVPGAETIVKNVYRLPPGHMLILEHDNITVKRYWNLYDIKPQSWSGSEAEACEKLKELLAESVSLRLISDVPVGVLLSGGLDSSSVVAMMSVAGAKEIKTFSVGFGEKDDELGYAKIIAERFQTDHHEFTIKPDNLMNLLEKIVWHLDEPIADGGAFATFLVSEVVKDYVKVILVGEGADELFCGYSWHKMASPYFDFFPKAVKKRLYFYLNTFYRGWENYPVVYKKFEDMFDAGDGSGDFLSMMSFFEMQNLLPNCLLMKVDKMTMAHSIEARAPFLDHKLLEFVVALPREYKINGLTGKYILRKAMEGILPQEIVERKKRGFLIPLDKWMESGLKWYANEVLMDDSSFSKNFLGNEMLCKLFRPQRGLRRIEYNILLWRLLIFEVWYRFYIKGSYR